MNQLDPRYESPARRFRLAGIFLFLGLLLFVGGNFLFTVNAFGASPWLWLAPLFISVALLWVFFVMFQSALREWRKRMRQ